MTTDRARDRFAKQWPRAAGLAGLFVCALLANGCQKPSPPPVVEAGGTLTLNGAPLPKACVRFIPMFEGFGAEVIAEAVTDDSGKFALVCLGTNGACVGQHRVTVEEGPLPREASGESARAQMMMTRYLQGLPNRPIPPQYGNVAQTPLTVEIVPDKATYDLKIQRRP
ncbi:MAG: hypothetical protein WCJ18_05415 [Planctomycetota bacterium]